MRILQLIRLFYRKTMASVSKYKHFYKLTRPSTVDRAIELAYYTIPVSFSDFCVDLAKVYNPIDVDGDVSDEYSMIFINGNLEYDGKAMIEYVLFETTYNVAIEMIETLISSYRNRKVVKKPTRTMYIYMYTDDDEMNEDYVGYATLTKQKEGVLLPQQANEYPAELMTSFPVTDQNHFYRILKDYAAHFHQPSYKISGGYMVRGVTHERTFAQVMFYAEASYKGLLDCKTLITPKRSYNIAVYFGNDHVIKVGRKELPNTKVIDRYNVSNIAEFAKNLEDDVVQANLKAVCKKETVKSVIYTSLLIEGSEIDVLKLINYTSRTTP